MKIDKTFKIKEKYFNAILKLEKPFELRHEKVEPNSIVKLECENGRYIIFRSKNCFTLIKKNREDFCVYDKPGMPFAIFDKYELQYYGVERLVKRFGWYDTFCWEYINKAPTYLIEIAEILEQK